MGYYSVQYRCPHCASYDVDLAHNYNTAQCRRCGKILQVNRFWLKMANTKDIWGWAAASAVLIGLNAVIMMLGLISPGNLQTLWLKVSDYATTDGVVITSEVQKRQGYKSGVFYVDEIVYEYHVQGKRYQSNRVAFGGGGEGDSLTRAQAWVTKYPVGMQVKVYYLPNEPYFAMLEPWHNEGSWNIVWFSVFFVGVALTPFVWAFIRSMLWKPA